MEIWLKEGDKNTKLFHKMANAHGKRNFCPRLEQMVVGYLEEGQIKKGVTQSFRSLYLVQVIGEQVYKGSSWSL